MAEIYAACSRVLRPGGLLVVVTKNTRRHGRCVDLAGLTVALAARSDSPTSNTSSPCTAAIRDGELVARPSFWQLTQIRKARERGEPAHLVVHEDVLGLPGARRCGHDRLTCRCRCGPPPNRPPEPSAPVGT